MSFPGGVTLVDACLVYVAKAAAAEESGEDSAGQIVPYGEDGCRQSGFGSEELGSEACGQTGILHAHLNAGGAGNTLSASGGPPCEVSQHVSEDVMQHHDEEDEQASMHNAIS